MLKLDAHQHFWQFDPLRDTWITEEMHIIRRDFLPADLEPLLAQNKISGCVAVQAGQSDAETLFLLKLARENSFIKGVVGWTDLRSAGLWERLEQYKAFPLLRGFRHILQAEEEGFMTHPDFIKGLKLLEEYNYTYDILITSDQLDEAVKLTESLPDQRFVIDHLAKPPVRSQEMRQWESGIRNFAGNRNVYCKLSGMVTEADHQNWTKEQLYPYMDAVLSVFGTERIMFGSDWPVCLLAADYQRVCDLVDGYLMQFPMTEQELIWLENAVEFYGLKI